MAANSKFAVAIHTLAVLGVSEGSFVPSGMIAKSVNTNPVVIRRLLCSLTKAGLVQSQLGKGGGARLARCPKEITLADVYRAIDEEGLFAEHAKPVNKCCSVSCHMKKVLGRVFEESEEAMTKRLTKTTIADLIRSLA